MIVFLLFWTTLFVGTSAGWTHEYQHLILDEEIKLLRSWPGPDGKDLPFTTFQEVEEFLRTANVISMKGLSEGVTGAKKVLLEKDGIQLNAIFRDVSINERRTTLVDGTIKLNFRDEAIFECAAYELSKILGLRYVPPTVQRTINLKPGTLQVWIEDCVMEKERTAKMGQPPVPRDWRIQQNGMYLFDNLINNYDRHGGNILVSPDWKMLLIDHTRSFTLDRELYRPKYVLFCKRDILARLRELDQDILNQRLGDFIGPPLVEAILIRRDLLVERLDKLIEERGEKVVIIDLWLK